MHVIVVDDQESDRAVLRRCLHRFEQEHHTEMILREYSDAVCLKNLNLNQADVIFLDIFMQQSNGMEAAKVLRKNGFCGNLIFITTSREFAVESYEVEASGYLVKPFQYAQLQHALMRCEEAIRRSKKTLQFVSERVEVQVYQQDLIDIEISGRNCIVHTKMDSFVTRRSMESFVKELTENPAFISAGKSYLFHARYVKAVQEDAVEMTNGDVILLPVRHRQAVLRAVHAYRFEQLRKVCHD